MLKRVLLVIIAIALFTSKEFAYSTANCDERYLPIFKAWVTENVWGDGAVISGPLDPDVVEKRAYEKAQAYEGETPKIAFGYANNEWKAFIQKRQAGDTLHFYAMDNRAKGSMMGDEGYVLIRNRKVIAQFITRFY